MLVRSFRVVVKRLSQRSPKPLFTVRIRATLQNYPVSIMDLLHISILFFGGLAAGLYASSVGGGGLLTLPLLLWTGLPITLAFGTQRLAAVILELASAIKFYKEKKVNLKIALPFGIIAGLGSLIGVNIILSLNEKHLSLITAVVLVIIYFVVINQKRWAIKERVMTHKNYLLLAGSIFVLGIWGGFFGAGFGAFIMVPFLIFGYKFIESAAMGRVIGFIMSTFAMIVFAQKGLINYPYAIFLGTGFAIGSWIGINIALKKGEEYIRGLLALVIIITAIKLILDFFGVKIF